MGVFARFRRRKSDASTEEVAASTRTEESAVADSDDAVEAAEPDGKAPAGEGVEIPKQPSADEAADSEAGESARQ
ncbi:gliding motility protein [Streptomyces palmae]|uniref:Gliding motility protein n=1 Tax=Streptomyces palmae TaxID=1701085 RepID=A0A4Z0H5Y5_9ACTN|nr:gliding motility protein [Streptomyces palmae]TGB07572.1 gliding motility protein [Streptomyces palmae]